MSGREIYRQEALTIWFTQAGRDQMHIVASVAEQPPDVGRTCEEAYRRIARALTARDMQIVHERIFGSLEAQSTVLQARQRGLAAGGIAGDLPFTYVQGRPVWGEGLAGLKLHAVRPERPDGVWTVHHDGAACGRGWERSGARFLVLQSVHGRTEGGDRARQARDMFKRADAILRAQGATYNDVVQTWIYLSRILEWYDSFNDARNAQYRQFGLMRERGVAVEKPHLPSSTGIQGENALGAASVMDVLALCPGKGGGPEVTFMSNVKQREAFDYGSAFSRGSAIREPDVTHIQVSGTAAIDEEGKSLFPGDARAQMVRTFDTVEALVAQTGAGLHDICDATVFLKRAEDAAVYREVIAERGLGDLPAVCVVGDVCREELLFETDGAAVVEPEAAPRA